MSYELFVARRYLKAKHRSGFLSVISFIAVGGVILGVAALVIMLSVTNGFSGEVKNRLIGMNAHVSIGRYYGAPIEQADTLLAHIVKMPVVRGAAPIVEAKLGLYTNDGDFSGVIVWGIDPQNFGQVSDLPKHLEYDKQGQFHFDPPEGEKYPGIIVGASLANRLRIGVGDRVFLLSIQKRPIEEVLMDGLAPKYHPYVVTDLFASGMYHYDDTFAFVGLDEARRMLAMDGVSAIHLRIDDLDDATTLRDELDEDLGYPFHVTDWTQQFPELFHWMELEKIVIFTALSLIIVVAAFNIMSILTMSILIKTPEIGILRAMGAQAKGIGRVFIFQGMFIGVFGTALGCLIGLAVCVVQDRLQIISIPSDIYIISSLPVDMQPLDFVAVSVMSIVICLLAAVIPARKAASLEPVEAIRYIM
ncbi:MAG: ABC transporter permease [bacterium]|nr:ABC transporter permease [bacterium]